MPHATTPGPHPQSPVPQPQATAQGPPPPPPDLRVNAAFSISQCRDFVTVAGASSQVTLAGAIQQTYIYERSRIQSREVRAALPRARIKFNQLSRDQPAPTALPSRRGSPG